MAKMSDAIFWNYYSQISGNVTPQTQYVSPTKQINYISEWKKIIVGRNNNTVTQKFKIDNRITDRYYFQIVNKNNQIVVIDDDYNYELYGSFIDAKNQMHVIFYSDTFAISLSNVLRFIVNTYNSEYLFNVKRPRLIDVTIKKKAHDNSSETVVLRDIGIAYPCPAQPEIEPTPVVAGWNLNLNGYTLSLNKEISGSISLGFGNAVYEADVTNDQFSTIAIGSYLQAPFSGQIVVGNFNNPIEDAVFIIGNGSYDFDNLSTNYSNALVVMNNGSISGGTFYSNGVRLATVNDISGFTYTAGEGIGISDQNVISLTATIPSSITQIDGTVNLIRTIYELNSISAYYWNSVPEGGCIWKVGIDYDSLHNAGFAYTSAIPSSMEQLDGHTHYLTAIIPLNALTSLHYGLSQLKVGINYTLLHNAGFAYTSAIPTSTSQLTNDSDFVISSDLSNYATTEALNTVSAAIPLSTSQLTNNTSNKIRISSDTDWHNNSWALGYDPTIDIYYTKNRCDSTGKIRIRPMSGYTLNVGLGFVVEQWMYVDDTNIETEETPLEFYIDEYDDIELIGDWPDTVENHKIYCFTRRVIKFSELTYKEQISFTSITD